MVTETIATSRAPGILIHPPVSIENDERSQVPCMNDGEILPDATQPMENEHPHTENIDERGRKHRPS